MNNLTEADKGYIAGFLDGEGCVGYYNASKSQKNRPGYFHTSVNICNTDPRVIRWLFDVTGIGKVGRLKTNQTRRRPAYQWQLGRKQDVIEFLTMIHPYLKIKAEQVSVILAHLTLECDYVKKHGSVTPEIVEARQVVSDTLKQLKRMDFPEGVETKQVGPSIN